jgi:glycosyl transferase, family 25
MKVIDYFDRIVVINLPERTDRKKFISKELNNIHCPIDSKKVQIFPAIRPKDPEGFSSTGARGCFLSHRTVLKQALDDSLEHLLIMEDDLMISEHFQKREEEMMTSLRNRNWDFVYFGHTIPHEILKSELLQTFTGPISCLHFIGINGAIFKRLLAFLDQVLERPPGHPDGGPMHVDGAYSTFRQQNPDAITLVANPSMGKQRSSHSDIAPTRWFDKIPVIKQIVNLMRSLKNTKFH